MLPESPGFRGLRVGLRAARMLIAEHAMSTSSWPRTVTLRDGARATLRPIAPEDKPLLAASFERLGEESRYRRFFTVKKELSRS